MTRKAGGWKRLERRLERDVARLAGQFLNLLTNFNVWCKWKLLQLIGEL